MKVIMWDVDDVLNDLMGAWFSEKWITDHPDCPLSYSDLTENPPHEILGISKNEYLVSLDTYRKSSFMDLKPNPEVLEWFRLDGKKSMHLAVTAVPVNAAHYSAAWVFKHFGNWIHSFNIVPSPREGQKNFGAKSKLEYIRTFSKVDIVVEDNLNTMLPMKEIGMKTVTIPRPWNKSSQSIFDALYQLNLLINS